MHVHIKRQEFVAVKIFTNIVNVKYNRMLQSHILHNLLASLGVVFVVILFTCASPLPRFLLADARREKKSLELQFVRRCSLRKILCRANSSSVSHVLCPLFCVKFLSCFLPQVKLACQIIPHLGCQLFAVWTLADVFSLSFLKRPTCPALVLISRCSQVQVLWFEDLRITYEKEWLLRNKL